MNIEKIDIMNDIVIRYDDYIKTDIKPLSDIDPVFWATFNDGQDLLTINITNPLKRVVKFYDIQGSIPTSFTEMIYTDMNSEQKEILDNFISSL